MLKDKLYNVVHWIGMTSKGLRADESPEGGLVSDSVVTLALREFKEGDDLKNLLNKDPKELFSSNFLVNSLDGETSSSLNPRELFRVWMIFTLYLNQIVFTDKKDPRALMLEKVMEFVEGVFKNAVVSFVEDSLKKVFGCDECKKKDTCPAMKESGKEPENCEEKAWN